MGSKFCVELSHRVSAKNQKPKNKMKPVHISAFLLVLIVAIAFGEDDEKENRDNGGPNVLGGLLALGLGGVLAGGGLLAGRGREIRTFRSQRHQTFAGKRECDYDCSGWPYEQCGMRSYDYYGGRHSATCISPLESEESTSMYSNY